MLPTSHNRTTVVLAEPRQYEEWKHQIRTVSNKYGLWPYLDPETDDGTNPILTEPSRPTASDILLSAEAKQRRRRNKAGDGPFGPESLTLSLSPTKISDLDEDKRAEYQFKLKLFERKLKRYDQQEVALKEIENVISITTDSTYRSITFNKDAPEMIRAVRE